MTMYQRNLDELRAEYVLARADADAAHARCHALLTAIETLEAVAAIVADAERRRRQRTEQRAARGTPNTGEK